MMQNDPNRRPSAENALQQWQTIRGRINFLHRRWRLRHPNETIVSTPLLDTLYALISIARFPGFLIRRLRRMFARIYS